MAIDIADFGGYNCYFVEQPPYDLICLICTFVAKDPQQLTCCGKIYCRTCLQEHKKHSRFCPQCRERGTSFEDKRSNRGIQQLKVKCNNMGHDCQWIGELQSLEKHLKECLYEMILCPNECVQDSRRVQLLCKDLAGHLHYECTNRIIQCVHCKKIGKFTVITTTHLEECQMVKILCTNKGCEEKIPRDIYFKHRNGGCQYERLPCKYFHIGCTTVLLRKDRESHESNDQLHLHLALETITKMQSGVVNSSTAQDGFTFKMKNFSSHKIKDIVYYSPPFYSKPGGYKLSVRIHANGWSKGYKNSVSVYLYFMRGENDDILTWPFTGKVRIDLLNQLQDDQHDKHELNYQGKNDESNNRVTGGDMTSTGYGSPNFIFHSDLGYHSDLNRQYLKDDCLFFRVTVDAPPPMRPWLTCNN